jgi:PAS domain S-box-containing protein
MRDGGGLVGSELSKLVEQTRSPDERYRMLFENSTDALGLISLDGTILDANERWLDLIGRSPADMIGKSIAEFAPPGAAQANLALFTTSLKPGTQRVGPVPLQAVDGRTVMVEFSSRVLPVDGRYAVLTIGHDVTERDRAVAALASAEQRYRSLVERIPDAIWTATADGIVTFVTENIERICGVPAARLVGSRLTDFIGDVHPDDQAMVSDAFASLVRDRSLFDVEYRQRDREGTWRWLHNRAVAIFERAGVLYAEGMLTDVTERRQLESELHQAQKMEAIGQLTGGIAHDFNNILAAILANAEFLREGLVDGDPRREDAEEIIASAQRAAALTRQLLAFSRRQVLEPSLVDLGSVVSGVEKMLRRLIGEDIELAIHRGADVGMVRADVGQIEQVIMNLVVNARDAMPEGGKVTIEIAAAESMTCGCSSVGGEPTGRSVMLAIRDTGCGMAPEVKSRVFEPFFTTKDKGKGTGLGLATCHGIIKQSGGHICVDSEPAVGTVFRIFLPRVDEATAVDMARSERPRSYGSETLLVIEDEDRVRHAVSRILSARGYRLLVASRGADAIALATSHPGPIDLVLSDVVMPGTTGPDVVANLRVDRPGLRVLFMSGYTDHAALRRDVMQNGANFIQKPFLPEALARRVRDVLDR